MAKIVGRDLVTVITAFLMGMLVFQPVAQASDWPNRRGPEMNGKSPATNLLSEWPAEGPPVVWRARVGTGYSSPTIANGRLYVSGHQDGTDILHCLDAVSGESIWTFEYDSEIFDRQHEGGPASSPITDGERVYIISRDARFFCVDALSGEKLWGYDFQEEIGAETPVWAFSMTALREGELVIVDMGTAVAMNAESGDIVWKSNPYSPGYSTPIAFDMHGKRVVAVFNGDGLLLLDAGAGEELGFFPWATNFKVNSSVPIIHDDLIYISAEYGQGAALVRVAANFSLESVWEHKDFNNHFNAAVLLDGKLYGYHGHYGRADVVFRCVDILTGEIHWTEESLSRGSVIYADGKMISLTGSGELVLFEPSPEEFKPISRFQALGGKCWTEPSLANGIIYLRNNGRGDLVGFDLRADTGS